MAKVRNLKYGIGNAPQAIVEQPIFKGTPLTKWIHNGIVVWENGDGIQGIISMTTGSSYRIDLSGEYPTISVISGSRAVYCNDKYVFRLSQATTFGISNDLVNWKTITLSEKIYQARPTPYGLLYSAQIGSSSGYNLYHITIDKDTLEIIDKRVVWYSENGFNTNDFIGRSQENFTFGLTELDVFWYGHTNGEHETNNIQKGTYDVETDEFGRDIVTGISLISIPFKYRPVYSSDKETILDGGDCYIQQIMFAYGGVTYIRQLLIKKQGVRQLGEPISWGTWLTEKAWIDSKDIEEMQKKRKSIKENIVANYPLTMTDEDIFIEAKSAIPFYAWQGGVGDRLLNGNPANVYDLAAQYMRPSTRMQAYSGFLGSEIVKDDEGNEYERPRPNIVMPYYKYNSTTKQVEDSGSLFNIYDYDDSHKVSECTNAGVVQQAKYRAYAYLMNDGRIVYDSNDVPYYIMYRVSDIIFRHKTDMNKNFCISTGGLTTAKNIKLDIPKEWFS